MNKKGQTLQKEQINQMGYAIFLVFVALVITVVFAQAVDRNVETYQIEQQIATYRLMMSEDCFGYNSNGDLILGSIDLSKFNSEKIQDCFSFQPGYKIGMELKLSDLSEKQIDFIEINGDIVAQKITCGLKGSDSYCTKERYYILYWDGNEMQKGVLDIDSVIFKG